MEKVTGIGGFFFRSENPRRLADWYKENLGIDLAPQYSGGLPLQQEGGFTVFDPFASDDQMIPEAKTWMINFRVNNLDAMVLQLRKAGCAVQEPVEYPNGKFASLLDPEGNGIQLWQPPKF